VSDGVFSFDGHRILTANWDSTAQIYSCDICVSFNDLLNMAQKRNVRQLTLDERVKYLHELPSQ
jgi:alkylhydroperoxidase family enzyme